MLARPSPSGPLATLPGTSRIRLPPSSITPAASEAKAKVSHLHSNHTASRRTAVFTDSPLPMLVQAEADHRRHAIIEQVIADLKNVRSGAPALRKPDQLHGPTRLRGASRLSRPATVLRPGSGPRHYPWTAGWGPWTLACVPQV